MVLFNFKLAFGSGLTDWDGYYAYVSDIHRTGGHAGVILLYLTAQSGDVPDDGDYDEDAGAVIPGFHSL
jgi:hypothetical protein